MRERWARGLAAFTGMIVLLLSIGFAWLQNPVRDAVAAPSEPASAPAQPAPPATDPRLAAGKRVYDAQNCARCHSVAGEGSPRSPLDGVGASLGPVELLHYATGHAAIAEDLSPRVLKEKQGYQSLPKDDLDALVAYLQSLR